MSERILVTGATGFIGARLAQAFAADGSSVRVLVRNEEDAARWRARDCDVAIGDLLSPESLEATVADIDTVVHSAAIVSAQAEREAEIFDVNAEGTRHLIEATRGSIRRFVFLSSIAVYGGDDFNDLDEDAPRNGSNPYGSSKIAAEDICVEAADRLGFELVILRPCQVYGPGDRVFLPKIRAIVENPDHRIYGDAATSLALVHVDDVVQATQRGVSTAGAAGRAYNITSGERLTIERFLEAVGDALDRRVVIRDLDRPAAEHDAKRATRLRMLRTLGLVRRPIRPLQIRDFTRSRHVSIDRAIDELAYRPAVSFDASIAAAVHAVR